MVEAGRNEVDAKWRLTSSVDGTGQLHLAPVRSMAKSVASSSAGVLACDRATRAKARAALASGAATVVANSR